MAIRNKPVWDGNSDLFTGQEDTVIIRPYIGL